MSRPSGQPAPVDTSQIIVQALKTQALDKVHVLTNRLDDQLKRVWMIPTRGFIHLRPHLSHGIPPTANETLQCRRLRRLSRRRSCEVERCTQGSKDCRRPSLPIMKAQVQAHAGMCSLGKSEVQFLQGNHKISRRDCTLLFPLVQLTGEFSNGKSEVQSLPENNENSPEGIAPRSFPLLQPSPPGEF